MVSDIEYLETVFCWCQSPLMKQVSRLPDIIIGYINLLSEGATPTSCR